MFNGPLFPETTVHKQNDLACRLMVSIWPRMSHRKSRMGKMDGGMKSTDFSKLSRAPGKRSGIGRSTTPYVHLCSCRLLAHFYWSFQFLSIYFEPFLHISNSELSHLSTAIEIAWPDMWKCSECTAFCFSWELEAISPLKVRSVLFKGSVQLWSRGGT